MCVCVRGCARQIKNKKIKTMKFRRKLYFILLGNLEIKLRKNKLMIYRCTNNNTETESFKFF